VDLVISAVAVLCKVLGSGLGARWGGFSSRDSLRLGVGMVSRGEVGLIVATAEPDAGLIDDKIFAVVALMVLATTVLSPVLLRALYPKGDGRAQAAAVQTAGKE
jgi:Kef-type K+ transport system membrane component KefB